MDSVWEAEELGSVPPPRISAAGLQARRPSSASPRWFSGHGRWGADRREDDAFREESQSLLAKEDEGEEVGAQGSGPGEVCPDKGLLVSIDVAEDAGSSPRSRAEAAEDSAGKALRLPVATDCFALVLVAENQSSPGTLLVLPLICVAGQCTVLVFLASTGEYAFAEGVWLTPRSDHASLMAMRVVGLMLSLLKASGEFASSLALFQALRLGVPPGQLERGVSGVRWAAFIAFFLQYLMALAVPLICTQIVLAEKSPVYALLKVLSFWVVVDMDNYVAEYVVEVCDWHHVLWSVQLLDSHAHSAAARSSPTFARRTRGWISRSLAPTQSVVHQPTSRALRVAFFGVPALLVFVEVGFALALNVLPFTYIARGFVSNQDPPILLAKSTGMPDGCCPPVLLSSGHGRGWNFSVLLLMPRSTFAVDGQQPAPEIFWVADAITAHAPSSLQVIDGLNGDAVPAIQVGGGVRAWRVQAFAWLLRHYGQSSSKDIFQALLGRSGVGLYKTHLPYAANFTVPEILQSSLPSYRIFVAAMNMKTLALSPEPIASSLLHPSGCPPGCLHCGPDLGRCFQCSVGRHWSSRHSLCASCAQACLRCDWSGDGLCDPGFCKPGFGRTEAGQCGSCNITGCRVCDRDKPIQTVAESDVVDMDMLSQPPSQAMPKRCDECEKGFGLLGKRHCHPCGEHCEQCETGREEGGPQEGNETAGVVANCSRCALGFGPVLRLANESHPAGVECVRCLPQCKRCRGPTDCLECSHGFASSTPGGDCRPCSSGCQNCTTAGPGKCDEGGCLPGYGFYLGMCRPCQLAHCTVCNFTRDFYTSTEEHCSLCGEGYGRTKDFTCEDCGESCLRCDQAGACEECIHGYTIELDPGGGEGGRCKVCGDRCEQCHKAGPARCDKCMNGYDLDQETLTCLPSVRIASEEM